MKFRHKCKSCDDAHYFCNANKSNCNFMGWEVDKYLDKFISECKYDLNDYCLSCKLDVWTKINLFQAKHLGIELKLIPINNSYCGKIEICFKCNCKRYLPLSFMEKTENTYCCVYCASYYVEALEHEINLKFIENHKSILKEYPYFNFYSYGAKKEALQEIEAKKADIRAKVIKLAYETANGYREMFGEEKFKELFNYKENKPMKFIIKDEPKTAEEETVEISLRREGKSPSLMHQVEADINEMILCDKLNKMIKLKLNLEGEKKMKFVIKDSTVVEEDRPVEINLIKHSDGDIGITANGVNILYLGRNGMVYRYSNGCLLKKMGFQFNEDGKVKIYGVDK